MRCVYVCVYVVFCGLLTSFDVVVATDSNICGFYGSSYVCCAGYGKDEQGECTIPICQGNCGTSGKCIRPDNCLCSDGKVAFDCPQDEQYRENGQNSGRHSTMTCLNNCNGQGECVQNKCVCREGYSGNSCEEEIVQTCYVNVTRGMCRNALKSIKLPRDICCGIFAGAWGDPCKKCQKSRCDQGQVEIDGICQDINECVIQSICKNGRCTNVHGSFRCVCPTAQEYDPNKADCVPVKNICERATSPCGAGMRCVVITNNVYNCQCQTGYVKAANGKSCYKRASTTFNICDYYGQYVCTNGQCVPDGYNYRCECGSGYVASSDGKSCKQQIDYCGLYQGVLCKHGKCQNTATDFQCVCDRGYTPSPNRKECTSMCDLYAATLCQNGRCVPTASGGYTCNCNTGYASFAKGKECRRIMNDESADGQRKRIIKTERALTISETDFCSFSYYRNKCVGGHCVNTANSYQCQCLPGFKAEQNGMACVKSENPTYMSEHMQDSVGSVEMRSFCDKYGSSVCTNGHCVESGSAYECRCNSGFKQTSDGKQCYDLDECAREPTICGEGSCTNVPGSYQCSCYDGYTIYYVEGGPKCYDRNECEEDSKLCANGICTNTKGSYSCACNAGYISSADKKQCHPAQAEKDVPLNDACKYCKQKCLPTTGVCPCPKGLGDIMNTGICAPTDSIVDTQIDIPKVSDKPVNSHKMHFDLVPGNDPVLFKARVTSKYLNTVVDICHVAKRNGKTGVQCVFHYQ